MKTGKAIKGIGMLGMIAGVIMVVVAAQPSGGIHASMWATMTLVVGFFVAVIGRWIES